MRRLLFFYNLLVFGAPFLLLCFVSGSQAQNSEILVEDYCRATVSLLNVSAREWQDRIATAKQSKSKSDRRKLQTELEKVTKKHRTSEEELFTSLGMSRLAYLEYAGKHKTEIEAYLEESPEVKKEIESVRQHINDLIQEFESTVSPNREGAQQ